MTSDNEDNPYGFDIELILKKNADTKKVIEELFDHDITRWEQDFLVSVESWIARSNTNTPSIKQAAVLTKLIEKYITGE